MKPNLGNRTKYSPRKKKYWPDGQPILTRRELELVRNLISNLTHAQAGLNMGITEFSVKVLVSRIYGKLRVKGRMGLFCWAEKHLYRYDPHADLFDGAEVALGLLDRLKKQESQINVIR